MLAFRIAPFREHREMERSQVMCRVAFDNKKWIAFYSAGGNLAKCRASLPFFEIDNFCAQMCPGD